MKDIYIYIDITIVNGNMMIIYYSIWSYYKWLNYGFSGRYNYS